MSNRRWSALVVTVLAGLGVMVFAPPCRAAVPLTDDEAAAVEGAMWWQDNCKCSGGGEYACTDSGCAPYSQYECQQRRGYRYWYCVRGSNPFRPCLETTDCNLANHQVCVCRMNYYDRRSEGGPCDDDCGRPYTSRSECIDQRLGCNP